jgi:hypothetical protein
MSAKTEVHRFGQVHQRGGVNKTMRELLQNKKPRATRKPKATEKAASESGQMKKMGRPTGSGTYQKELEQLKIRIIELQDLRKRTDNSRAYLAITQALWKLENRFNWIINNRYYQFKVAA